MLLDPLPLSQTVKPSRTPSPSSVTYFMDGHLNARNSNAYVWVFLNVNEFFWKSAIQKLT